SFPSERISQIFRFYNRRLISVKLRMVVMGARVQKTVELIETPLCWIMVKLGPQMPLADRPTNVACRFQQLWQGQFRHWQAQPRVCFIGYGPPFVSKPVLITASNDSGSRRTAMLVCGIAVCAERTISRHGIDIGCWYIRASIEADISIAEIIRQNKNDVRGCRLRQS